MILDLDDSRSTDPAVAGAKGAGLARARRAGLPVLPGIVVPAVWSLQAMAHGSATLPARGSGGARSVIIGMEISAGLSAALAAAVDALGEPVIVRSSSVLEGDGAWSGAFTSYQGIGIGDLDTAVRGCWASAFTVATLARTRAAGLEPGASPMAIVVQRSIDPVFGGTARLDGTSVVVNAVAGSPAPLVQGWETGVVVRVGTDGAMAGTAAVALLGGPLVRRIAETLRDAQRRIGATACEWASTEDGAVALLQVAKSSLAERVSLAVPAALREPRAQWVARLARRSPGPLGESLILGWALGERGDEIIDPIPPADLAPSVALRLAMDGADRLLSAVWQSSAETARHLARRVLRAIRGTDPGPALAALDGLAAPDPARAREVRALLARVRCGLVEAGEVADVDTGWYVEPDRAADVFTGRVTPGRARIGVDRWEPFAAAVVLVSGRTVEGTSAAPGIGHGRLCFLADPGSDDRFRPRDVVVVTHPVPSLGALLWDAAGLVTLGGGPAAHLFEAARSVGVPAVCGAPLDTLIDQGLERATGRYAVALDGDAGVVAITPW